MDYLFAQRFQSIRAKAWAIIALACGYWALAVVADRLTLPGEVTAIWPATGLAAAAMILLGYWVWPGVLIGVYLNQMTWFVRGTEAIASNGLIAEFVDHTLIGLSYGVGNTLEAVFILWLVRTYCKPPKLLNSLQGVATLIIVTALVGPLIGTTFGTLITCGLWQWVPWSGFWQTFWTWWVSAAAGVLVVTMPIVAVVCASTQANLMGASRWLEFVALVVGLAMVLFLSFWHQLPIEYLSFLILLWAASRFGQATTISLAAATGWIAIVATTQGYGPFLSRAGRDLSVNQSLTLLQCFTSILLVTSAIVATIVLERRSDRQRLQRSNMLLEKRVDERTADLRVEKERAERANDAKSRFFATASHDLRQPLHAMNFFVDALSMEQSKLIGSLDPGVVLTRLKEQALVIEKMRRSVENMRNLFNGILDISRIDANVVSVQRSNFLLSDLLSQLDRDFRPLAATKGLMWQCDRGALTVCTDPILLERVLRNLLDNALKFSAEGSVAIRVRDSGELVHVTVADTGVGISDAQQRSIFEEFYQVDGAAYDGDKGLGLGLAIVRRLTDLLGHELQLNSRQGVGTSISIAIPKAAHAEPSTVVRADKDDDDVSGFYSAEVQTNASVAAKILLVDDDNDVEEATKVLLSRWGYDVRVAGSGAEAFAQIDSSWSPSVAIVDYRLGGDNNGIDLIDRLRTRIDGPLESIIVSASTEPEFLMSGERHGLVLLTKPVKPGQLRSAIRSCLRRTGA